MTKFGHMTQATPTYYGLDAVGVRPLSVPVFEAESSIRSKVMRGPKISKFGHVTQATPT